MQFTPAVYGIWKFGEASVIRGILLTFFCFTRENEQMPAQNVSLFSQVSINGYVQLLDVFETELRRYLLRSLRELGSLWSGF